MANAIQAVRDWASARKLAANLEAALLRTEPPNGVDVSRFLTDARGQASFTDPDLIAAKAIMLLQKKHPTGFTVLREKKTFTLIRTEDFEARLSPELKALMRKKHVVAPGTDLIGGKP